MTEITVLFIDDEIEILNSLKRQLRKENYKIITAAGGSAALEILKKEKVQIVVSDEKMPRMNGIDLLRKVKALYPETVRIILSGYTDMDSIIKAVNKGGIYRFISKPWTKESLLEKLDEAKQFFEAKNKNQIYMEKLIEENRKLKKQLDDRNDDLNITTEILDQLPNAVLALNRSMLIEQYNGKALTIFGNNLKKGTSIDKLFSHSQSMEIIKDFSQPGGQNIRTFILNDKRVTATTRSLRKNDRLLGLVFLETKGDK